MNTVLFTTVVLCFLLMIYVPVHLIVVENEIKDEETKNKVRIAVGFVFLFVAVVAFIMSSSLSGKQKLGIDYKEEPQQQQQPRKVPYLTRILRNGRKRTN